MQLDWLEWGNSLLEVVPLRSQPNLTTGQLAFSIPYDPIKLLAISRLIPISATWSSVNSFYYVGWSYTNTPPLLVPFPLSAPNNHNYRNNDKNSVPPNKEVDLRYRASDVIHGGSAVRIICKKEG